MRRRERPVEPVVVPEWVHTFDRQHWVDQVQVPGVVRVAAQGQFVDDASSGTPEQYLSVWCRWRARRDWQQAATTWCAEHGFPAALVGAGPTAGWRSA